MSILTTNSSFFDTSNIVCHHQTTCHCSAFFNKTTQSIEEYIFHESIHTTLVCFCHSASFIFASISTNFNFFCFLNDSIDDLISII
ncbi:hypothetical protein HOG21_01285 [bacterium]|jgi:hypothetical protein|nr:hypothetical protein [bacterium]